MSWIKSFKNSKGGYDSFEWSIEKEVKSYATSYLLSIIVISILSFLVPVFILFIYPFSIKNHRWHQGIIGMVAPIVCLLDFQFGLANWYIFSPYPEVYSFLCTINIAMFIVVMIFFFFDDITSELFVGRVQWSWPMCILFVYLLYPVGNFILEHVLTMTEVGLWG